MDYIAVSKKIKIAPRKVRLVVDGIKQSNVERVLWQLVMLEKRSALPIKKTIESAIANAVHNFKVKKEDLILRDILVEEGSSYKRFHYAARGRIRPYKKRTSHIKVILGNKSEVINSTLRLRPSTLSSGPKGSGREGEKNIEKREEKK